MKKPTYARLTRLVMAAGLLLACGFLLADVPTDMELTPVTLTVAPNAGAEMRSSFSIGTAATYELRMDVSYPESLAAKGFECFASHDGRVEPASVQPPWLPFSWSILEARTGVPVKRGIFSHPDNRECTTIGGRTRSYWVDEVPLGRGAYVFDASLTAGSPSNADPVITIQLAMPAKYQYEQWQRRIIIIYLPCAVMMAFAVMLIVWELRSTFGRWPETAAAK